MKRSTQNLKTASLISPRVVEVSGSEYPFCLYVGKVKIKCYPAKLDAEFGKQTIEKYTSAKRIILFLVLILLSTFTILRIRKFLQRRKISGLLTDLAVEVEGKKNLKTEDGHEVRIREWDYNEEMVKKTRAYLETGIAKSQGRLGHVYSWLLGVPQTENVSKLKEMLLTLDTWENPKKSGSIRVPKEASFLQSLKMVSEATISFAGKFSKKITSVFSSRQKSNVLAKVYQASASNDLDKIKSKDLILAAKESFSGARGLEEAISSDKLPPDIPEELARIYIKLGFQVTKMVETYLEGSKERPLEEGGELGEEEGDFDIESQRNLHQMSSNIRATLLEADRVASRVYPRSLKAASSFLVRRRPDLTLRLEANFIQAGLVKPEVKYQEQRESPYCVYIWKIKIKCFYDEEGALELVELIEKYSGWRLAVVLAVVASAIYVSGKKWPWRKIKEKTSMLDGRASDLIDAPLNELKKQSISDLEASKRGAELYLKALELPRGPHSYGALEDIVMQGAKKKLTEAIQVHNAVLEEKKE